MLLVHYIKVTDVGGSMVIHMFGAYFGLAVAFVLRKAELRDGDNPKEGSTVTSDLFSMIGRPLFVLFSNSLLSVLFAVWIDCSGILQLFFTLSAFWLYCNEKL